MTTTSRRDFDDELGAWLEGVKAAQGGVMHLRFITIPDDADQATLDAAMIVLSAKKAKACIASTKDEIQADMDQVLERRTALTARP